MSKIRSVAGARPKAYAYLAGAAQVLLFVGITSITLLGQISQYAVVSGMVRDPSGASVPKVQLTLTDQERNISRTTTTSASGDYVFADVIPSTYTLSAEGPGFKRLEQKDIVVETQARLSLDITLAIGAVSQTVEVSGAAPVVQTATASQGATLSEQSLADLPNVGRNIYVMARVTPNVIQLGSPWANRMQDQSNTSSRQCRRRAGWRQRLHSGRHAN